MTDELEIVRRIKSALTDEPRIHLRSHPVAIAVEPDGAVVLQGELPTIAAKKTALDLAAAVPGVTGIVDRLRVAPSQKMTDGEIRDHLRDALVAEPAIDRYEIRILRGAQFQTCREASADSSGRIDLSVDDGVVTLAGRVDSLSHQRLVGAIAWWVPGTRDVINGLEVAPEQQDSDEELEEAVKLVLEKDPLVNADQVLVNARDGIVTLEGVVANDMESDMVETDAWSVLGVERVKNRLKTAA